MSVFGGGPKDEIYSWIRTVQHEHNLSNAQMIGVVLAVLAYMAQED